MFDHIRVKETRMKVTKKPVDVFIVKKLNILKKIIITKIENINVSLCSYCKNMIKKLLEQKSNKLS